MSLKEDLAGEMENTRRDFHHLLDSLPESFYHHPSDNPAWTIGDVLYHITLGPPAIRFEVWMIRHAPWLMSIALNALMPRVFNWGNALFAQRPKRITPQGLARTYDERHADLISSLKRMREEDFSRSVNYPKAFVSELAGVVTIERLFRYITVHFNVHAEQIRKTVEEIK